MGRPGFSFYQSQTNLKVPLGSFLLIRNIENLKLRVTMIKKNKVRKFTFYTICIKFYKFTLFFTVFTVTNSSNMICSHLIR